MRRSCILGILILLLALAAWWLLSRVLPPTATLPDGTKLIVHSATVGEFNSQEPPLEPWFWRVLQELPPSMRRIFVSNPTGGRSSGRSYQSDIDQSQALHCWLGMTTNGSPIDPDSYRGKIFIVDDFDRLYPSFGFATVGTGQYFFEEHMCHSFAAFPRWEETLEFVAADPETHRLLFRLPVENPIYLTAPITNWPTATLPQRLRVEDIEFEFVSLEPTEDTYTYRAFEGSGLKGSPQWKPTLHSHEPNDLNNTWHTILYSFYDNYGNHSLRGLPPRLSVNDGEEDRQWQIRFIVAADHRSLIASNRFWTLPAVTLPSSGKFETLGGTNLSLAQLTIRYAALAGSGIATFTNLTMESVTTSPDISGNRSSSFSRGQGTNRVETLRLTRPHPHLTFAISGAPTNFYFTCRAIDVSNGTTHWLGTYYRGEQKDPIFQRMRDTRQLLEWNCEPLKIGTSYQFVLGIHPFKVLDFFIQAPVYASDP